jgi:hypothetical protein
MMRTKWTIESSNGRRTVLTTVFADSFEVRENFLIFFSMETVVAIFSKDTLLSALSTGDYSLE